MPRFNIELRTESHVRETVSVESNDLTALRIEVAQFVGEMLRDHANAIWTDEDWRVDVTDDAGLILFVLHISAINAAAPKPRKD
jgi:hypothetical protein